MDGKGRYRIFGRISVLDIALVFLLVVFLVLAQRFSAPQSAAAKPGDKTINYVVEVAKKPADFLDKIEIGADLYDSVRGYHIGKITDAYLGPYRDQTNDDGRGIIARPEVDDLYCVFVAVEAEAQVTEKSTLIGQYEVLVGKDAYIRAKGFVAGGYVVSLEGVRG